MLQSPKEKNKIAELSFRACSLKKKYQLRMLNADATALRRTQYQRDT